MLSDVHRALLVGSALFMAGCSLDVQGLESAAEVDSGRGADGRDADTAIDGAPLVGDSRTPLPETAPTADDGPTDSAPIGIGACANPAAPCVVVPSGWTLVAFASTRSSPCPPGFGGAPSDDVVEGPSASDACACGACSITTPPSCAAGAVAVTYDTRSSAGAGLCGLTAAPSPLKNDPPGSCGTDIYQGNYSPYDLQYAAPPPSGGACNSPGIAKNAAVTYASQDRVCVPDSPQSANCTGSACQPNLAGPYGACIASPGAVACPAGPLAARHMVGTSASFSCAACGCTFTSTCSGTLTLFTDAACTKGANAISTDVCVAISTTASYKAYEYQGAAAQNVACQTAAPGPAQNVALADEETICCAQ